MNSRKKLLLLGTVASCLFMASCGDDETKPTVEKEGKKKVDKSLLDPDRSFNTTFDGKLFSVPSPVQTALLIKSLEIPFNETLLNNKDNMSGYTEEGVKAMNLGIYGADLGYVTLYDQNSKALSYLSAVESLANDLGISGAFDKTFLERFEANSNNEDSMLVILSDAFRQGDNFLKENERKNTSALILTGGWLESMHLATALYKESKEPQIIERIGQQKQSLETIIELLEKYNDEGQNDEFIADFKSLNELFKEIKVSYEFVEPTTDKERKLTTINSKMNIEISDELAEKIIEKVKEIRGNVTNTSNPEG
tara:strand:+ start:148567 stop:149496 length:930 start_codon:yes stop_codon:yes gene_type:complete